MLSFLSTGALLGLSAGIAPGPLLALVVSETLAHDLKAGIKVALAPLITDLPIILMTTLLLAHLSHFNMVLGCISVFGGFFVSYLGIECIRTRAIHLEKEPAPENSIKKGILVNALSPHPYLFWFSVGGPTLIKALQSDVAGIPAYLISFYGLLVGSKIILAVLVAKSRAFLSGMLYINVMRFLGFCLCGLAGFLFTDGLKLLGII